MTQSDDNSSVSLWTSNFGLWNSSNGEIHNGELWNGNTTGNTMPSFQKINGFASAISKDSDKPTYATKLPETVDILASWSPLNSILPDAEKTSIWSSSDLYAPEDKNLSLSASSLPWPSNPQDANPDIGESNNSTELWELPRNTLFFGIPELDLSESWKFEQSAFTTTPDAHHQAAPTTTVAATTETIIDSTLSTTSLSNSTIAETNSAKDTPCSPEDSTKSSAFSTEQLCDHLINSHEGWGKRPVDQSTPWDMSDVKPGAEQLGRSGITTPTPGSCSTATLVSSFRVPTQLQRLESNVWTSEPPTGTGIWEMHYENGGPRPSLWPTAATNSNNVPETPQNTQINPPAMLMNNMRVLPQTGTMFPRPGTYRNWDSNEKMWNNAVPTTSGSAGRPVLGGTRVNLSAQGQIDESGWGSEANSVFPGPSTFNASGNCSSWDTAFTNPGAATAGSGAQWNTAISTGGSTFSVAPPFSPPNADDLRRQLPISTCNPSNNDRMLVHPFSNTYRADLVKYLMSQGFKKEDVQAALIDSNMEPERALHELRERYNPSRSFGMIDQSMKSNFHGTGGNPPQFPGNGTFSGSAGSLVSSNSNGAVPLVSSNNNNFNRSKLMGLNVTSSNNQLMSLSTHPNPQLIRQQLTQQVRSALNLSMPNPLTGGPLGNATTPAGNSLLGQPPPPLLNASAGIHPGHVSNLGQSITGNAASSFASGHNRTTGSNHMAFSNNINGPTSALHNAALPLGNQNKRQARQVVIFTAIQELQKKRRSIQQQVLMYKNNPAMSSQPQCADVFAELQGQLQQIEAQLQAKLTQLSQVCAQDSVAGAVRGPSATTATPVEGVSMTSQSRMHQDHLVQPLLEMQLKPSRLATGPEIADTEFPAIGTWTPHTKASTEQQDKALHDSIGTKTLTGMRTGICSGEFQNGNSNTNSWAGNAGPWSVNGTASNSGGRSGLGHVSNWSSATRPFTSALDGGKTESQPLQGSQTGGASGGGQWLLIQSAPGQGNVDLNNLRMLLSQFGLTNFHSLNPFTGLVMVQLQSSELTMRLMYHLADRFTVEIISESEALAQLQQQQRNMRFRSDNCTSGQFSPLGDINGTLSAGTMPAGSKWATAESASGFNTVPINPRKPNSHNSSHLGVMVSGIH